MQIRGDDEDVRVGGADAGDWEGRSGDIAKLVTWSLADGKERLW